MVHRRRMRLQGVAVFVMLTMLWPSLSHAYVSIRTSGGAETHWAPGSNLLYRTNTANSSGMTASDIFSIFTSSLQRWQQAAYQRFLFTYYQGTDANLYPTSTGVSSDNLIFFTSQAGASDQLGCGTIGLTMVWFDPGSGSIMKTNTRFNDKCFTFTNNPTDTVSERKIYLGDVATHELGHALGLDHSQVMQSSMVYTAAIEMSIPSCDDQAAMIHLYGSGAAQAQTGTLTGSVVSAGNASPPVFGAHVEAIQFERGTVMASALTDHNGSFSIAGLEPGHYAVMVEPYYPGSAALNQYYSGISSNVCSNGMFNRTFVSSGGKLNAFTVAAGGSVSAGTVSVDCSAPTSLNGFDETALSHAPVLAAENLSIPIGTQSVFSNSYDHYYQLANQSGHLEVNALAYTLYAPFAVKVEFLDSNGQTLGAQTDRAPAFSSAISNYNDYNAFAEVDLPASTAETVYVHVSYNEALSSSNFPSASLGVSATPYYALTVSRGLASLNSVVLPATNARCENLTQLPTYPNQGTAPPIVTSNASNLSNAGGGCGVIYDSGNDRSGGGSAERAANFISMILMAAIASAAMGGGYRRFPFR